MSESLRAAGVGASPAPAAVSGAADAGTPRLATPADIPEILRLIRELAEYERALHEVRATPEQLHALLFEAGSGPLPGPVAACHVIDAERDGRSDEPNGVVPGPGPASGAPDAPRLAAMALWFRNASTWLAVPGIYLEDLYVSPQHRGRGHGRRLLATLARICVEHGYGRVEWSVLDWNSQAIAFYRAVGAVGMEEWTVQRLTGPALTALAASEPRATSQDR